MKPRTDPQNGQGTPVIARNGQSTGPSTTDNGSSAPQANGAARTRGVTGIGDGNRLPMMSDSRDAFGHEADSAADEVERIAQQAAPEPLKPQAAPEPLKPAPPAAIPALLLAILGMVLIPALPSIGALILVRKANDQKARAPERYGGDRVLQVTRLLAWFSIGFTTLSLVLIGLLLALGA